MGKNKNKNKNAHKSGRGDGDEEEDPWAADDVITPSILRQLIFHYFPSKMLIGMDLEKSGLLGNELIYDDGLKIIENILKHTNRRLLIYDNAISIKNQLKRFRRFSGSQYYLEMKLSDPYDYKMNTYTGRDIDGFKDKVKYMSKQDIYHWLQWTLFKNSRFILKDHPKEVDELVTSTISLYFKCRERKYTVGSEYKLIEYSLENRSEDGFISILKQAKAFIDECPLKRHRFKRNTHLADLDEMYRMWKGVFSYTNVPEYEYRHELKKCLEKYYEVRPPYFDPKSYAIAWYFARSLIYAIRKVIINVPEYFEDAPLDEDERPVVRVFVESAAGENWATFTLYSERFVMRSELNNAFRQLGLESEIKLIPLEDPDYESTLPWSDEWIRKYPQIAFCDFVVFPTRCTARPIMAPSGKYCVLARHAIMEIFHDLAFGSKMWQMVSMELAQEFKDELANLLLEFFKPEKAKQLHPNAGDKFKRCQQFILCDTVRNKLKPELDKLYKKYGKGGVSVDCLDDNLRLVDSKYIKNELERLQLKKCFPEMVKQMIGQLDKETRWQKYRLYAEVENGPFVYFMDNYPRLWEYMLTQVDPEDHVFKEVSTGKKRK